MMEPMSMARLAAILDAYGADPARWPGAERDAALALLAASPAARARQAAAAELDACLDAAPSVVPAPDLAARIVAAVGVAPAADVFAHRVAGGSMRVRWRLLMMVPLAAAAALAVWLVREVPPAPTANDARTAAAAEALDTLEVPTDALLDVAVLDSLDQDAPTFGCTAGELGCPELEPSEDRQSDRSAQRSSHA
jgi:hypothetical protein